MRENWPALETARPLSVVDRALLAFSDLSMRCRREGRLPDRPLAAEVAADWTRATDSQGAAEVEMLTDYLMSFHR